MLSDFTCLELELFLGGSDPSMLPFKAKHLTENSEEHHRAIIHCKVLHQQLLSGHSLLQKSGVPRPHHYRVTTPHAGVIGHVREKTLSLLSGLSVPCDAKSWNKS